MGWRVTDLSDKQWLGKTWQAPSSPTESLRLWRRWDEAKQGVGRGRLLPLTVWHKTVNIPFPENSFLSSDMTMNTDDWFNTWRWPWIKMARKKFRVEYLSLTKHIRCCKSGVKRETALYVMHWVGQKVCLGFSIASYGKPWMNFLANPIFNGAYYLPGTVLDALLLLYLNSCPPPTPPPPLAIITSGDKF